jgi:stage II sporulation protein D
MYKAGKRPQRGDLTIFFKNVYNDVHMKPSSGIWSKGVIMAIVNWRVPLQISLVAVVFLLLNCGEIPIVKEEIFHPQIRQPSVTVKLLESRSSLAVNSNGAYVIRCFLRQGEKSIYYASAEMEIQMVEGRMVLSEKTQGELETDLQKVSFVPKEGDFWIYLNDNPYRGLLEVVRNSNGESMRVLNLVYVEDYLKGVVPAEIGKLSFGEMEALKAQAVAARTYSLSNLGQYAEGGYDLEATIADQVYKGVNGEYSLGNQAVELTQTEVLVDDGNLVHAYYHANSGGKTEDVKRAWGKPPKSYLIPVEDEDFCSWANNYSWEESWTSQVLINNVQEFLRKTKDLPSGQMGSLLDLRVLSRTPSGRVEVLEVLTDQGSYRILGDRIRWALRKGSDSGSILPSTRFELQIQRDAKGFIQKITARGKGNGHGVGMCQTGAIGMARKGYSYKDILNFYYRGAKIINWN